MSRSEFSTPDGRAVPAVTAAEMAAVDRVAVEEVGLGLLQMMENAGRILARHVRECRDGNGPVAVLAGSGGNGGGGLACARHLANRGVPVRVLFDRPPGELSGAAAEQYRILDAMGIETASGTGRLPETDAGVMVDALVGYGLDGPLREPTRSLVGELNGHEGAVVSLDVPSGIDATTGETLGTAVGPDRTVTLALPKTGLDAATGALYVADISVPAVVYRQLNIEYDRPFGGADWIELKG